MKAAAAESFVLDASVALSWCFEDESDPAADRLLGRLGEGTEAVVPPIWSYETANAILTAERRGRLTQAQSTAYLSQLEQFNISTDASPLARIWDRVMTVARDRRLTAYDAAYLELALRRGLPLATLDEDLKKAAKALGVELLS